MQPGQPQVQASPPAVEWPATATTAEPATRGWLLAEIDASIGKNKMQKATNNNRFNIEAFSFKSETNHVSWHAAFYQQFVAKLIKAVYDTDAFSGVADRLIAIADQALDLKQTETVEHISHLLTTAPLPPEYQGIGHYYHVFCLKRRGEIEQSRAGFQRLAEAPSLPLKFRARAIQALGASYRDSGQHDEAARFFVEAGQAASMKHGSDLLTMVNAQLMIAVTRSVSGDHEGALLHLENMRGLVRLLAPRQLLPRYLYTNSLAVELAEVGRLEEAKQWAEITARSTYVHLYPEWQETYDEVMAKLRRASPSVVAGIAWPEKPAEVAPPRAAGNVVILPLAVRPMVAAETVAAPSQPGRVLAYHGWQRSLPEPCDTLQQSFTYNDLDQMSIADKQRALLDVIYSDQVTHHTLDQLLAAAGRVKTDVSAS
jgi:tetratricopeptide (TPR) repeat protein